MLLISFVIPFMESPKEESISKALAQGSKSVTVSEGSRATSAAFFFIVQPVIE